MPNTAALHHKLSTWIGPRASRRAEPGSGAVGSRAGGWGSEQLRPVVGAERRVWLRVSERAPGGQRDQHPGRVGLKKPYIWLDTLEIGVGHCREGLGWDGMGGKGGWGVGGGRGNRPAYKKERNIYSNGLARIEPGNSHRTPDSEIKCEHATCIPCPVSLLYKLNFGRSVMSMTTSVI